MKKICISLILSLFLFLLGGSKSLADDIVVVIDPGHGGDNLGAQVNGIIEKDINLKVATAMYDELSKYEGVTVYMTHEEDEALSLKKRAKFAKEKNADYLICLHFNASETHLLYGTECWVPYDKFYEEMYELAAYFNDELTGIGLFNRGIKTRLGDGGDNYYGILRESEKLGVPCVLVEHCHLDNENDEGYYETDEKLKELGKLDARAMAKYLGLKSRRLNEDYSDYTLEVTIPRSENTRDKTGPDLCALTVKEYKKETGEVTLILTTREDESRLLYYDYSYDGGATFSNRIPLEEENIEISFTMEEGVTPAILVRAYSLNDAFTESNLVELETVTYPQIKEDVSTIYISKEDENRKESRQKILTFAYITAGILIVSLLMIMTLYLIKVIRHSKRRKRKNQAQKRRLK